MQIYFERFLYQVTCPAAERSIKEYALSRAAIKNVIEQVISQIIQIPGLAEFLDYVYRLGHCFDPNYHGLVGLTMFRDSLFPAVLHRFSARYWILIRTITIKFTNVHLVPHLLFVVFVRLLRLSIVSMRISSIKVYFGLG